MLIDANILGPLISAFEEVIKFFHSGIGGSWGWSIILLTLAIRVVLLPLTIKQFHSMQKLQRLTPEIKRLQAKYKQDKQRQQQEMMKLYQEHGVNPFSSCLPFVVQIPVLYALYFMLRSSLRNDICPGIQSAYRAHYAATHHVSLQSVSGQTTECGVHGGANFLFIPDLTNHATGIVLVVLIVLYVATQLGTSLLMSSPTMDKRQRQMMLILPLVFVFIIIGLPAGVIVYWITTNALMLAQQYGVKKIVGPMAPLPAGDGARSPPKDGAEAKNAPSSAKQEENAARATADDNVSGGGFRGMFLGRARDEGQHAVGAGTRGRQGTERRSGPPPRPPRKRKKRSGRRR